MDILILANIVGILASVLGLVIAIYGIFVSGPRLGEMIKEGRTGTENLIREVHADTQRTLDHIADTQRRIAELIHGEGEQTREEVRARS
jgi:hypothetical protein